MFSKTVLAACSLAALFSATTADTTAVAPVDTDPLLSNVDTFKEKIDEATEAGRKVVESAEKAGETVISNATEEGGEVVDETKQADTGESDNVETDNATVNADMVSEVENEAPKSKGHPSIWLFVLTAVVAACVYTAYKFGLHKQLMDLCWRTKTKHQGYEIIPTNSDGVSSARGETPPDYSVSGNASWSYGATTGGRMAA